MVRESPLGPAGRATRRRPRGKAACPLSACVFVAHRVPADPRLHARRGQEPVLQRQVRQRPFLASLGMKQSKTFTPFPLSARRCWISSDTHLLYIIHGPICAALLVGSGSPALTRVCVRVRAVASQRRGGGGHSTCRSRHRPHAGPVSAWKGCCVSGGGRGRSSFLGGGPGDPVGSPYHSEKAGAARVLGGRRAGRSWAMGRGAGPAGHSPGAGGRKREMPILLSLL